ncbi:hypothetical protein ACFL1Y_01200 [Patescibacteria group bacterium]
MAKKKWYFYNAYEVQKSFSVATIAVSEKPLPEQEHGQCPALNKHLRVDPNMPNNTEFVPVIGDPRFLNEQVTKIGNAQDNPELFPGCILKEVFKRFLGHWWALQYADGKMLFVHDGFLGDKQKYTKAGLIE